MASRIEKILTAIVNGDASSTLPPPQSRNEDLLIQVLDKINGMSGGTQSDWAETDTTSPAYIKNKPALANTASF